MLSKKVLETTGLVTIIKEIDVTNKLLDDLDFYLDNNKNLSEEERKAVIRIYDEYETYYKLLEEEISSRGYSDLEPSLVKKI